MPEQSGEFQAAWADYADKVLPKPCGPVQLRETHQAFYAGGLVAMGLIAQAGNMPEIEAQALLTRIDSDIKAYCDERALSAKAAQIIKDAEAANEPAQGNAP